MLRATDRDESERGGKESECEFLSMLRVGSHRAARGRVRAGVGLVLVVARGVRRARLMTCSRLERGMSRSRRGEEWMEWMSLSSSRAEVS